MASVSPERVVWPGPSPVTLVRSDRTGNPDHMRVAVQAPLLRMGCGAWSGRPISGGQLIVEPGTVRFEVAGATLAASPVIHARPPLMFMRARLLPPGFNSGLVLRGDEGTVTVFTGCGLRARLRRALDEAEVAFFERLTWVSVGWAAGASGGVE
jgi:hypothetical protein